MLMLKMIVLKMLMFFLKKKGIAYIYYERKLSLFGRGEKQTQDKQKALFHYGHSSRTSSKSKKKR